MFYLKVLLTIIWALFACTLWIVIALFSWRNPKLYSKSAHFISWGALKILGFETTISGDEHLKTLPSVMISNHQSVLDTFLLGSIWPARVVPIGKKEIGWVPIIGWWFVACGARLINRQSAKEARSTIEQQIDFLKKRVGIGITPEGTRNKAGKGLLPFKKGAFHLAIKAQVPIVILVVAPLGEIANWKTKRLQKARVPIKVLPPIPTEGMTENDVDNLIRVVREKMEATLNALEKETVYL